MVSFPFPFGSSLDCLFFSSFFLLPNHGMVREGEEKGGGRGKEGEVVIKRETRTEKDLSSGERRRGGEGGGGGGSCLFAGNKGKKEEKGCKKEGLFFAPFFVFFLLTFFNDSKS